jgi:hypothetical protein
LRWWVCSCSAAAAGNTVSHTLPREIGKQVPNTITPRKGNKVCDTVLY